LEARKTTKLSEGIGRKIVEALRKQSSDFAEKKPEEQPSFKAFSDHLENPEKQESQPLESSYNETEDNSHNDDFNLESDNKEIRDKTEESVSYEADSPYDDYQNEEVYEQADLDTYDYYENDEKEAKKMQTIQGNKNNQYEYSNQEVDYNENEASAPVRQFRYEEPAPQRQYRQEIPAGNNYEEPKSNQPEDLRPMQVKKERPVMKQQNPVEISDIELPANVATLMHLISQLPSGVTRQTGAQIIRQTLEAMGVSMHRVLTEAQQAQDSLSQSIKNNINTIEELINRTKILEKEVQQYRRKADELEDLVSLFILSEKESRK